MLICAYARRNHFIVRYRTFCSLMFAALAPPTVSRKTWKQILIRRRSSPTGMRLSIRHLCWPAGAGQFGKSYDATTIWSRISNLSLSPPLPSAVSVTNKACWLAEMALKS